MHYVHQDGQAVYKYAVRKMVETTSKLLQSNNISAADLGCFIPHQANKRVVLSPRSASASRWNEWVINIDRYGNTTAATIPLAMQTALDEHCLKHESLVLLASVGAGFSP